MRWWIQDFTWIFLPGDITSSNLTVVEARKHLQLRDDRMNIGEGQAGQASKYLGLRIIRSLGKRSPSIGK
jgi:hypothetical protein